MSKTNQKESLLPPLWVLTVIFTIGCIWLLTELKELIVLLLVGYTIAYVIDPILDFLERKKVSRNIGFFAVFGGLSVTLFLVGLTAVPPLVDDFNNFSDNLPAYTEQVQSRVRGWIDRAGEYIPMNAPGEEPAGELKTLPSITGDTLKGFLSGFMAFLLKGYSITLFFVNLALLPFIVYYLAIDLDRFHSWILKIIPRSNRKQWERIFKEINSYTSAFVLGQTTVAVTLFVLYAIGFYFVGLKQWFLLAVIAGFGNIVPYLGTVIGILLSTLMALVSFGDFSHVLYTWIVFAVVQFLEGVIITPKIIGDKVGLSPLLVILAIFAGGKLFGLLGIFLAIPLAAVVRVLIEHGYQQVLKRID